jgi:hypothetical protein
MSRTLQAEPKFPTKSLCHWSTFVEVAVARNKKTSTHGISKLYKPFPVMGGSWLLFPQPKHEWLSNPFPGSWRVPSRSHQKLWRLTCPFRCRLPREGQEARNP